MYLGATKGDLGLDPAAALAAEKLAAKKKAVAQAQSAKARAATIAAIKAKKAAEKKPGIVDTVTNEIVETVKEEPAKSTGTVVAVGLLIGAGIYFWHKRKAHG